LAEPDISVPLHLQIDVVAQGAPARSTAPADGKAATEVRASAQVSDTGPPREQAADAARPAESARAPLNDVAEAKPVEQARVVAPDNSAETQPGLQEAAATLASTEPTAQVDQKQPLREVAMPGAVAPVASRMVAASAPAKPEASPADTHEPRVRVEAITPPRQQPLDVARPADRAQDPPRDVAEATPVEDARVVGPEGSVETKPSAPETVAAKPPDTVTPPALQEPVVHPMDPIKPPRRMSAADEAALWQLNETLRTNPNDAEAYYGRGQLYARNGRFNEALPDFDHALRIAPNDADALNNRCWIRAVIGDLQDALSDCDKALSLQPTFVDALDSRGFIYLKLGLLSRAIADYDAAIARDPKKALSLFGRGKAKIRNDDTAGGDADLKAAQSVQPDIASEFADYGVR